MRLSPSTNRTNITAFWFPGGGRHRNTMPLDAFSSQLQLAELVAGWPTEWLVTLWNSIPGATVKRFKNSDTAASRIWDRIQDLGEAAQPQAQRNAKGGAQSAGGTSAKSHAAKKASPAKAAPKAKKSGFCLRIPGTSVEHPGL